MWYAVAFLIVSAVFVGRLYRNRAGQAKIIAYRLDRTVIVQRWFIRYPAGLESSLAELVNAPDFWAQQRLPQPRSWNFVGQVFTQKPGKWNRSGERGPLRFRMLVANYYQ